MWSSFLSLEMCFGFKPRVSDLFAKSRCTLIFTLLSWKMCEMTVLLLFSVFPYCMFYFRISCLAFAFIHGHVIKYCPSSFLWNKREQLCSSFSSVKQIVFKMGFFTFKWNVSFVRESLKWFSWGIIVSLWVTGKVGTGQSSRRLLWLTAEDDGLDMHDRIFSMWKEGHLSCGSRCPD